MVEILSESPLLLLFIVTAIGYGLGSIKIKGSSLGVAAVLFVGLAFGAIDPSLQIPNIIFVLGLSIFVYTVGLSSGPGFFATFKRRGFQDLIFVISMLTFSAALTASLHFLFGFKATTSAGLFAGTSTNTPALAGILDTYSSLTQGSQLDSMIEETVVGYSLSYPMGVLGVMIAILVMQRVLKIDYKKEAHDLRKEYPVVQTLDNQTIRITNQEVTYIAIRDLIKKYNWSVVFGRVKRGDKIFLSNWDTELQLGDLVRISGSREELDEAVVELGDPIDNVFAYDQNEYELKRIFVSNPQVAGQTLASLNLSEQYAAIVTRVRRGDVDLLAKGDTVIELGDRVRFIARKKDVPALVDLFGDSYQALGQINLLSFGLGMALGLLLGMITFELPGGVSFKLGFAGGPLIVALVLGWLRRTGPIVWTLPYSANLTLRQIGLILLLAVIGIRSGHTFVSTILEGGAGTIFLAGTIISVVTALITLLIGYVFLKIPFSFLTGMVSNQPAILDFATQKSGNQLPNIGYALMFPVALVIKIVYVQILYALL